MIVRMGWNVIMLFTSLLMVGWLAPHAGAADDLPATGAALATFASPPGYDFRSTLPAFDKGGDDDGNGDDGGDGGNGGGHGGGDGNGGGAVPISGEFPPDALVITIYDDDGFSPAALEVDPGQEITFANAHDDPHTATGSGFDTGIIQPGATATVAIDEPGTYAFACLIHPNMVGTIGVRGPDGLVPPPKAAAPPPADAIAVQIVGFAFNPASVTVTTGTTVAWTNADRVPHTVTALDGSFDSSIFDPGSSFTQTFNTPGAFPYQCLLHPAMQGEVIVTGEAIATTPAPATSVPEAPPTPTPVVGASPEAGANETVIAIVDFGFDPASVTVAPGTTVVWTNLGQTPHTVTGDFGDSGALTSGSTFRQTFAEAGAYDYVCAFHPDMHGEIVVAADGAVVPSIETTPVEREPTSTATRSELIQFLTLLVALLIALIELLE